MSDGARTNEGRPATFEQALERLEAVVAALEDGRIPLSEALARYEEGVGLLAHCYQTLAQAERRIELLSRVDAEGRAHGEPFDDSALSLEEKAQARSRRRSRSEIEPPRAAGERNEIDGPGRLF
jgi:exodeoxyribonuclease VII small subunit